MTKVILPVSLLLSLILSACTTKTETRVHTKADTKIEAETEHEKEAPVAYYLPPATIGKPYRQIIHIRGDVPRTVWAGINPDDSGLQLRFIWSDSSKKVVTNRGDMIEISGTPRKGKARSSGGEYIKVGISGYGHEGQFDNDYRVDKGYFIKLLP